MQGRVGLEGHPIGLGSPPMRPLMKMFRSRAGCHLTGPRKPEEHSRREYVPSELG